MASYTSLEQIEAARRKREGVFEKARALFESGQISEADFRAVEAKFRKKMAALDAAAARLADAGGPRPAEPAATPEPTAPAPEGLAGLQGLLAGGGGPSAGEDPLDRTDPLPGASPVTADRPPVLDPGGAEDVITSPPTPGGEEASEFDDDADEGDDPFGDEGPPRGLDEMTGMASAGDSGTADFRIGAADGDLLNLVKGARGRQDDDVEGLKIELQTERSAREQAEKEARAKATEASDMHAAFRRTVEEKDLIGAASERTRIALREFRQKAQKAAAGGLALLLLVSLWSWSRVGAVQGELAELRAAQADATAARAQLEGDLGEAQEQVADLRGRVRSQADRLVAREQALQRAQARALELEQEVSRLETEAALPGLAAAAGVAPEPLDVDQLHRLAQARLVDLEAPRRIFLRNLPEETFGFAEDLAAALEERPAAARTPLEQLVLALLDGRFDPALQAGERWRREARQSLLRASALLGRLYLAYGSPASAVPVLEPLREAEGFPRARMALAEAYVKLERRPAAEETLRALLEAEPDLPVEELLLLGTLAERARDAALATRAYQQARAVDPEAPGPLLALSGLAIERADFAAARPLLEDAAAAHPDNLEVQYNLALAYLGLGDRAGAGRAIERLRAGRWRAVDLRDLETRLADLPAEEEGAGSPVGG